MAVNDGEHGSKDSGGGCSGYFSAQPWWACQTLTGRETPRENTQSLETLRFTPLTYLAWIGPLPLCSISNSTLSFILETVDDHIVGDNNAEDNWNCNFSNGQDRAGEIEIESHGKEMKRRDNVMYRDRQICKLKIRSHGDINPRNILTFYNEVEAAFMDFWIIKVVLICTSGVLTEKNHLWRFLITPVSGLNCSSGISLLMTTRVHVPLCKRCISVYK